MSAKESVKVSVVVPVYQSAGTIAACIESIRRQSLSDLEMVLVDDGSTDGGGALCDRYASMDARIKVVHQENRGRSEARLKGVRTASGQWIAFVDADDTLPADSLSDLYAAVSDDTDIVLGNGQSLFPETREVIPMSDFRHLAVRGEGSIGVPWGSLYRRSVLSNYLFEIPPYIYNGEDYLFWLRLVFLTQRPVHVVYKCVYNKGTGHTSSDFVWTAAYCRELNDYRVTSIPEEVYDDYADDVISDRLANMFAVAVWQKRGLWLHSRFYRQLMADIRRRGYPLSCKSRVFLSIPSLRLRRLVAKMSAAL